MYYKLFILFCTAFVLTTSPATYAKDSNKSQKKTTLRGPISLSKSAENKLAVKKQKGLIKKNNKGKKSLTSNDKLTLTKIKNTPNRNLTASVKNKAPSQKPQLFAQKNTQKVNATQKRTLAQTRQDIVQKAIASARNEAKIQPVSAISSTLYGPTVHASGVVVIHEHTGQILFEKNAHQTTPIASISKVMAAMVVLDAAQPMNEMLTIGTADVDTLKSSSSRLAVGTELTRAESLLMALAFSENRTTSALARHYLGGKAAFIHAMNQKAQQLGMHQTKFFDPTGLDSRNTSTPHDLSIMVVAANRYPEIHQFSTSLQYTFTSNLTGKQLVYNNSNPLIRNTNWNIGLSKTGYIREARKCLVMQATVNNQPLVIVLLGSLNSQTRVSDAQTIKRWIETNPAA